MSNGMEIVKNAYKRLLQVSRPLLPLVRIVVGSGRRNFVARRKFEKELQL